MSSTTNTGTSPEANSPTITLKTQPSMLLTPSPEPATPPAPIRNMGPYKVAEDLYLSPFSASDTLELHRVLNLTNAVSLGLYTANVTFPFPLARAEAFTRRHEARRAERGFADAWAIRPAPEGPVMGLVSLQASDHEGDGLPLCYHVLGDGSEVPKRCGTIGYWLSPEATGKGIMTRVVDYALQQMARQLMGYERVHGEAWEENTASHRVMERAGMQPAAPVPCFVPKFDQIKICAQYILDV